MQEQTKFKIGDIVHLNSGSPDWKIVDILGEKAIVEWPEEIIGLMPKPVFGPRGPYKKQNSN
jgi:hypothetical protein